MGFWSHEGGGDFKFFSLPLPLHGGGAHTSLDTISPIRAFKNSIILNGLYNPRQRHKFHRKIYILLDKFLYLDFDDLKEKYLIVFGQN